ncbi:bifunctional aminoglycoside phosphotransferase/ATP-binding protein [Jidongwangia harbinensis]|uniref:bifunctional aminoglycoside phosphotransferase/ATP-binding protein n=1 Tax=Jidongwangia harbinensis TaxID=2878561 RepID=UPI001CD9583A|nr:AAA family ATPase [Jidongwangia harbinensis]MCA2218996.1 AAA family ATPase [Jidongwangia harbinensis]
MGAVNHAATIETHAAALFFVGDRAYKMKKPVNLGFLDFRSRADREAACHREVDLNRRLAPDVYLGVADVLGPDGRPCDHLVVMRRMSADRRLSSLVRAGVPVSGHLRRLARVLAAFHATARRGPAISAEGTCEALRQRWDDSFAMLQPFHGGVLDAAVAARIETLTHDFLAGRAPLFDDRIAAGRIVDGHADLLADDIFCLDDGPRILDCIEFDDRLRYVDMLDDAAFLAMDVEHLGAANAARDFLDRYAAFSGDTAPAALRHHYLAYRAFVRAKVACLRRTQGDATAATDVADHVDLTLRHLRAGVVRLVLVGGLPGTGKSTLAGRLADRLGAVLISSDRIRKELAGLDPACGAAAAYRGGIYTAQWTERTYAELLRRAHRLLERGESVVLDASWIRDAPRQAAHRTAADTHSVLVSLRCTADPATVDERLRRRAAARDYRSDADAVIAAALAADADPWPQSRAVPTGRPADLVERDALAMIRRAETPAAKDPCEVKENR